jgi:hypothetical protein
LEKYRYIPTGSFVLYIPYTTKFEEIDPFEFQDTLTFESWGRGRSSAYFIFRGNDQQYQTGMDGMTAMIPHMINGVIKGTFCFRKQGTSIYVHFVKP